MTKMTAGTYYIGDLCYVLSSKWTEFCALTIDGHSVLDGVFTMVDGTTFATFGTAYGDGCYMDEEGQEYPVDAGLIGCVLVESVDKDAKLDLGNVHTFESDFEVHSDGKVINFGNISIDTDPVYEDEDDYEDYDHDDDSDE